MRAIFPALTASPDGADVTVKDTKRYVDTHRWGYYRCNQHEPKPQTAKVRVKEDMHLLDTASAKKDDVRILFHPLLDKLLRSLASPEVRSLSGKSTMETTNVTAIVHSSGPTKIVVDSRRVHTLE